MTRWLLFLLLSVLFATTTFGWDLGIAPGLSIKNAFIYLAVVTLLIENSVFRSWRFDLPSLLILYCFFVGYCIVSWYTVSFIVQPDYYDPVATFITLKIQRIDNLLIFLLFFLGPRSSDQAMSLLRAFLWMIVVGNLLTVVDGFNIPDLGIIGEREDGRLGGPMGEVNQYGALLAMTLPAVVALNWDKQHTWMPAALIAVLISILAILTTGSRGAIAGIVVGSMWSMYYLRATIPFRKAVIGILVSIGLLAIIIAVFSTTDLFSQVIGDFVEKSSAGTVQKMSSNRTVIWRIALERMFVQPIGFVTGFGFDAYDYMRGSIKATHNVYLNIMFNLGLPGLLLYLALLINIFVACRRALHHAEGAIKLQLTAFVFGFSALSISVFFVDLYKPWIFIWAYVGLTMSLAAQTIREGTAHDNKS